jgi:hypothetical protein
MGCKLCFCFKVSHSDCNVFTQADFYVLTALLQFKSETSDTFYFKDTRRSTSTKMTYCVQKETNLKGLASSVNMTSTRLGHRISS